jgi:uncharacterized protein YbaP (TraB family)
MQLTRRFACFISLCLIVVTANADEITLDQIFAAYGATSVDAVSKDVEALLRLYNKHKGHRAIAVALTDQGGVSVGLGYKAQSELAASITARNKCEQWMKEGEETGICEIVVLGDDIIEPGSKMIEGLDDNTPAMAWRVDGPNSTLYLLGTIHMLKSTILPLPKVFDQFFVTADQLALEVNPIMATDPLFQANVRAMIASDAKTLKKQFDRNAKKVVRGYAKDQGVPVDLAYSVSPVVSALQVTQIKSAAIGYTQDTGVEMHYARQASVFGKVVIEMEDAIEVMSILFDHPIETQIKMFVGAIEYQDEIPEGLQRLVKSWLQGDVSQVYEQTVADMVLEPELAILKTRLLDERNQQWMIKLEEFLKGEESTVVMVGAAHFGGQKGLLALLKARGFDPVQYGRGGETLGSPAH